MTCDIKPGQIKGPVHRLTRRNWIRQVVSAAVLAPSFQLPIYPGFTVRQEASEQYNIYFGDLHNHNEIGYARGSLERSFEIAEHLLDFFALTPHAHWHDIGTYEGNIEQMWLEGFKVTKDRWKEVLELNRKYDQPGRFVPFAGYEWHSTDYGDYHVLFPELEAELFLADDLKSLQQFVRQRGAIMIHHHLANRQGMRGANFEAVRPDVTPLIEVYSEWGNSVSDRGPYPYIRHSHGGRWTRNTLEYRLAQGDRFGIVASTDDHLGKPGAYPQGLAAVLAPELSREALFDAFRRRRTYAVTGDRIQLNFTLDGHQMGEILPYMEERTLKVDVTGWHQVDMVEILKNNRVIHRDFPVDRATSRKSWEEPVIIWFLYGWGPWAALPSAGIAEWDLDIRINGGSIKAIQPAFLSGPFSENHRDQVELKSEQHLRLRSFTARQQEFEDRNNKGIALKILGQPESELTIVTREPSEKRWSFRLSQLAESSEVLDTGPYPRESALVERVVFANHYQTAFEVQERGSGRRENWYMVRVRQANGQIAWSSPIWVERN